MKTWAKRTVQGVAGLAVGLVASEAMFYVAHDGAFPHLNLYQPDTALGVRLRPHSSMQLAFAGNPKTQVRVNAQGYRGEDWPDKAGEEVLVVGDSQVFGLGVEEEETFSAQLQNKLKGVRVLNAGVPTYGALEYRAVVEEVGLARKPETVVLVINMSNDLFEAERPNRERHAVWDGWAVRKETAPEPSVSLPGKSFLFNRSHAVFALRKFLYGRDPGMKVEDVTLPSEGTFRDLVQAGSKSNEARASSKAEQRKQRETLLGDVHVLKAKLGEANLKSADLLSETFDPEGRVHFTSPDGNEFYGMTERLRAAKASPGDIVGTAGYVEGAGPFAATATEIHQGAALRRDLEEKAKRLASEANDLRAKAAVASLDEVAALEKKIAALEAARPQKPTNWSPLAKEIEATQQLCQKWGARLVVVVLPLDVQVSDKEWAKYGSDPGPEMQQTLVLNEDVLEAARNLGAWTLDPRPALAGAEPGAFLNGDLHMSPTGHAALATALSKTLQGPAPFRLPAPGLPEGTARAPSVNSLRLELSVKGSTNAGCATFWEHDWFHMRCAPRRETRPEAVLLLKGGHGEVATARQGDIVSFTAPLAQGESLDAKIAYADGTRLLHVEWPKNAPEPSGEISDLNKEKSTPGHLASPQDTDPLCACALERAKRVQTEIAHKQWKDGYEIEGEVWGKAYQRNLPGFEAPEFTKTCVEVVIEPRSDCEKTYPGDCEALLACAAGDPWFPPSCQEGSARGGAMGRCIALCDEARPCASGVCTTWQGAGLCFQEP